MKLAEGEQSIDTQKTQNHLDNLSGAVGKTTAAFVAGKPSIQDAMSALGRTGTTFGRFAGYLEGQIKVFQDLSNSGINFGGQLDMIQISAINAGLGLDQLKNVLKDNSEVFAAIGSTTNEGAMSFITALEDFRTAQGDVNGVTMRYSTALRRLGMDFDEFAENMAYMQTMEVLSMRRSAMSDAERNRATFEFSKELDALSKLTGKNRDELRKEMAARAREGDFRAFTAGLSKTQADAVQFAMEKADAAGFGDLFKDYLIRGFPSEDQRMLAGMSGDMVELFTNMRNSLQSGDMDAFAEQSGRIQATGASTLAANRELAMLGNTTRATTAIMNAYASQTLVGQATLTALSREASALGVDIRDLPPDRIAEIAREQQEAVANEQERLMREAQERDSRAVTQALLSGQEALIDGAAEIQKAAIGRMYDDMLTPGARNFTDWLNSFNTNGNIQAMTNDAIDALAGASGTGGDGGTGANNPQLDRFIGALGSRQGGGAMVTEIGNLRDQIADAEGEEKTRLQEELRNKINQAAEQFGLNPSGIRIGNDVTASDMTVNAAGDVTVNGNVNVPGAYSGTLGAFGSVLNDFGKGTLMELHNREAILNEQQLNNLVAGSMQMGSQSSVQGLQGMLNNIRPQMQQLADSVAPATQNMAEQMTPMMQQLSESSRQTMQEMANAMKGPLEHLAATSQQSMGIMTKQLRAQRAIPGNIFGGLKI